MAESVAKYPSSTGMDRLEPRQRGSLDNQRVKC